MAFVVDDGRYVYGTGTYFYADDGEAVFRIGSSTNGFTAEGQFVVGLAEAEAEEEGPDVSLTMWGERVFGSSLFLTESGEQVFSISATTGLTEGGDHAFLVAAAATSTLVERGIRGLHRGIFTGGYH